MTIKKLLRILFVEDLPSDAELAILELRKEGLKFEYIRVDTRDEFIKALKEFKPDIIISDYMMPSYNGMRALKDAREFDPSVPFILFTGSMNEETAVECLKAGAVDYVIKEHMTRLPFAVKEALEQHRIQIEKRAAELLLKENEEKLQSIFRVAPVGIGLVVNRIFMEVNDTYCKMTGYTRRELIGKSSEMVYTTHEEYEFVGREKNRQIAEKGIGSVETRLKCKDGKVLNIISGSTPLDASDLSKGLTFTVLDITERKQVEEALSKEKYLIYSLMDNLPDHIFFKDLKSRFIRINKAQAQFFGLDDPRQCVGKTDFDFFTGEHATKTYQDEQTIIQTGQPLSMEERETHPNRSDTWVSTVKLPLHDELENIIGTFGISRDITERKLVEEGLRESESSLRNAQEIANMGSWEWDLVAQKTRWSDNYFAIHGFKPTEIEPSFEFFRNRIYPDDVHLLDETHAKVMKDKTPTSFELRLIQPDGTFKWIQNNISPVIEDDKLVKLKGVIIDINERKRAEEALRESEVRYKTLFSNTAEGILAVKIDTMKFLYANPGLCKMFGYKEEELIHLGVKDIHPKESLDHAMAEFGMLMRDEKTMASDIPCLRKDGTIFHADIRSTSMILDGFMCLVGFFIDITDQLQAQKELLKHRDHLEELVNERTEELHSSLEETRDLYENAPCGYQSIDADGKFVRINNTELKWLGYTADELVGKLGFADLLTPESLKKFKSTFTVFMKQGELSNLEFEIIRKDGSTFFVSLNATAIYDGDGKFLRSRSTLFDITERKVSEEKLNKAKKEAEEANRAKSEFLANMSHEIRTPMNAVLGYTELLSSMVVDQTQKDYINSIKSSGRSLLTLINDILDLSKIEAGKLELEYNYVDTYSFFSEFERIFSLKVSEKGLNFILDITSGTPAGIYIDEARVRQIVFNLIGNAIKFTSEGKIELKVFTENPQIVNYSKEKTEELIDLIIEIQDTGIGISKELQEAIFEPFVQERDNKNYGGTGLGLTITRRLTSLMDGTIHVQSKPGKGSIFTVRIPEITYLRDFSKTTLDIQIDPSEIVFEKASILIADDVEHNRSYLRDALKNANLKIVEAEDGIAAYKLAKEIVPDLIIADILMPKMDGFQLLDKIKTDKKLKHIPVIAYSASVLKDQKERIHDSEFAGLLIKPVKVAELYLELMSFLPYKSTREVEPDKPLSEVDLIGEITNLPRLIHSLETGFYATWKTFAVRQPIGEIRDFGKNLIQLGLDHNSSIITGYGKELNSAADSFNIEAILKLIGKYNGIIESLKVSIENLNND